MCEELYERHYLVLANTTTSVPPRTEYGTVDCLVLRTGSCTVAKSRGNSYAPVGARDMMMMMMSVLYNRYFIRTEFAIICYCNPQYYRLACCYQSLETA